MKLISLIFLFPLLAFTQPAMPVASVPTISSASSNWNGVLRMHLDIDMATSEGQGAFVLDGLPNGPFTLQICNDLSPKAFYTLCIPTNDPNLESIMVVVNDLDPRIYSVSAAIAYHQKVFQFPLAYQTNIVTQTFRWMNGVSSNLVITNPPQPPVWRDYGVYTNDGTLQITFNAITNFTPLNRMAFFRVALAAN